MSASCPVRIGGGDLRPDLTPGVLFLTVEDVAGNYCIPYIQSSSTLKVRAENAGEDRLRIELTLRHEGETVASGALRPDLPETCFSDLPMREYALDVVQFDSHGSPSRRDTIGRIGIGHVLAAIGDSITEGYHGRGFWRDGDLSAKNFSTGP